MWSSAAWSKVEKMTSPGPNGAGRDLFRPLADEHEHQRDLGVAVRDGGGDRPQHHRLAGLRRGHDEPALALPIGASRSMIPGRRRRVPSSTEASRRDTRGQVVEVRAGQAGRLPLTVTTASSGRNLPRAVLLGCGRAVPSIRSPFLSPYWRICTEET